LLMFLTLTSDHLSIASSRWKGHYCCRRGDLTLGQAQIQQYLIPRSSNYRNSSYNMFRILSTTCVFFFFFPTISLHYFLELWVFFFFLHYLFLSPTVILFFNIIHSINDLVYSLYHSSHHTTSRVKFF
jgi:hypothetical protein